MNDKYELTKSELQVLTALWELGAGTVRDVMNHLTERNRCLAYTTVMTFLARLETKGFVASDKSGLAFVYKPLVSRERIQKNRLKNLVTQLYDGAAGALVLQLVRTEQLSSEELAELHKLIDRLDASNRKQGH